MKNQIQSYLEEASTKFDQFERNVVIHKRRDISEYLAGVICFLILFGGGFDLEGLSEAELFVCIFLFIYVCCFFLGYCYFFRRGWFGYSKNSEHDFFIPLAEYLQMNYRGEARLAYLGGLNTLQKLGFIPPTASVTQHFWKEDSGELIDIFKLNLFNNQDKDNIVYYGMAFSYHLHTPVQGTTLLVTDGLFAKFKGKLSGLHRIRLEWLEFEKTFDLFSTDEKESRVVFAPDVMAVIYDFYQAVNNPSLCFIFEGSRMSCFYVSHDMSLQSLSTKVFAKQFFCQLYLLGQIPVLFRKKLMASAWQEKEYVASRKLEQIAYDVEYAPVNQIDQDGFTPIMHSILENNIAHFNIQVKDPNLHINQIFRDTGNTLLHMAVLNRRYSMAKRLLEHPGIDVSIRNKCGETALDIASRQNTPDILNLLQQRSFGKADT